MKKICVILFLLFAVFISFSQQQKKIPLDSLKAYEGIYEYAGHQKVSFAASPKDTALVAILNQSQYVLKNEGPDIFSTQYDTVHFFWDAHNRPAGYISKTNTFNLISRQVFFPESMWYPRVKSKGPYSYKIPETIGDGLSTGDAIKAMADTTILAAMMQKIITGELQNVHSILILKDGRLVFEEYFYQYTKDSVHELRSATKSFVSALAGIAIDKGFIKSKNEKVLPFFPEYNLKNMSDGKKKITIEQLLTQQTGLDCDISNSKSEGNETTMDYSDDWVKFTLDLPQIDSAGGKGMYCSGNPITLGRIIEKATSMPLLQFAKKSLFDPLGFTNYQWNFKPDKSNAENYCQVYLTPREMLKFGLLYLNKGAWKGVQLVSPDWVSQSFASHSVIQNVDYGYLWWLKYLNAGGTKYYSKTAQGNGGQRIYVLPAQNMVVVITGGNYNTQSPSDPLMATYILPAFFGKK